MIESVIPKALRAGSAPSERGAVLVELTYSLPLLLVFVLGAVHLASAFQARVSLNSAVSASRLAFTRGEVSRVGTEMILEVNDWHTIAGSPTNPNDRVRDLLSTPGEEAEAFQSAGGGYGYNSFAAETFGVNGHNDLPPSYSYALAYAYLSMSESIGPTLRYPCDPNASGGAGCMECRLMHPETVDTDGFSAGAVAFGDPDYDVGYLGIQCRYRLDNTLASTVSALMGMLGLGAVNPFSFTSSYSFSTDV